MHMCCFYHFVFIVRFFVSFIVVAEVVHFPRSLLARNFQRGGLLALASWSIFVSFVWFLVVRLYLRVDEVRSCFHRSESHSQKPDGDDAR